MGYAVLLLWSDLLCGRDRLPGLPQRDVRGTLRWLWSDTVANIVLGILPAVIDNIPVMFAILTMNPEMDLYQWLLIILTAGVGGSLLSVGSAAGVALMGQARGLYTFFGHLRWSWAIALGYAVPSIPIIW